MKREIQFAPAWDRRSKDQSKNYGIHGVEMRWLLIGKVGAIQFLFFTNWQLPHVEAEQKMRGCPGDFCRMEPMAADFGYHSPKPIYEDQTTMGPCKLLGGKNCYYDGSGLAAEEVFRLLVEQGHEAVWKRMEETYIARFGELK